MITRDVNEAGKVRGQGRGQIPQAEAEVEAKAKKICKAGAELCEAEAREAVLTINY